MANKPLKGINFPGLEDTYIIPQPDQTYDATSENAQSGIAVAQAIGDVDAALDEIIKIQEELLVPNGDEVSY